MQPGDGVLFYHSNADPPAIVGLAEVVGKAYPDPTQFDRNDSHFDPASDPEKPRWEMVDIRFVRKFGQALPLDQLRQRAALKGMELLRKGSRLSVQPVAESEWKDILKLARS
jgi:predicted RNA-binding protein with PUA-like domain